jgi:CBS domain-containing protein
MSLERLIRRPVRTLAPDASCREAAVLMRDAKVGAVVVAEGNRPLGVVTDRDLVVRVLAPGDDPDRVRLREVMSSEPVFLAAPRSLDQLIASMRDLTVRRVPIVDEKGSLQGMITMDDLHVLLAEQLADLAQVIQKEIAKE